ncbi:hypothetical protein [Brevibacterium gallinarum]|uniref:Uncharacterized protein n=1 Tax=Brevibacterium gallinarum TaxID=2762220 RepID=A0ABR8WQJ1_9MICO|nr:hypothetical protein [Brevibacterium gallinarum]MBD8019349.1 hypothetical protein [Brevibacterium gallinarum]
MTLKFPNSDLPLRYRDIEALEATIAHLSARLIEETRMGEAAIERSKLAGRELEQARQTIRSLVAKDKLVPGYVGNSGAVLAPNIEEDIFDEPPLVLRDAGWDARISLDGSEVVVNVGADPETGNTSRIGLADDENAVSEAFVLSNDEVELKVRLDVHPNRNVADGQQRESGHDSSPSVGGCGCSHQPTEGGARKGRDDREVAS